MINLQLANEAPCPVPAETLAQLYRSGGDTLESIVGGLPETQRIKLAMFCYSRAHLRPLAMSIAARCDATRLEREAGNAGYALAVQCQHAQGRASEARISLAGTRH